MKRNSEGMTSNVYLQKNVGDEGTRDDLCI